MRHAKILRQSHHAVQRVRVSRPLRGGRPCRLRGVEYVGPYDYPPGEIAERLRRNGLSQALFNLPAGDWAARRARHRHPARSGRRVPRWASTWRSRYAKALSCAQVNCVSGIAPEGADRQRAGGHAGGKSRAMPPTGWRREGIRLLLEPINPRDIPGFFVNTSRHGAGDHGPGRVRTTSSCNTTSITCRWWRAISPARSRRNLGRIAHIQIADNPGRHEPGTGEINIDFLMGHLDRIGYTRLGGCRIPAGGRTRKRGSAGISGGAARAKS